MGAKGMNLRTTRVDEVLQRTSETVRRVGKREQRETTMNRWSAVLAAALAATLGAAAAFAAPVSVEFVAEDTETKGDWLCSCLRA